MAAEQQFCTFFLNGLFFGIEVEKVQEVIRHQAMTPVPLAPKLIGGLINLRGQIVTAIDLRLRLGLPERKAGELAMNVVARTESGAVSLLVDEIGDVLEVQEQQFEDVPQTMRQARELIRGVYKLPDRLLLVLDTAQAVSVEQGALKTVT
jgi:purine-binding chemotaxis protein CheW